ncbi:zinc finger protein 260-like [Onthophagus taurus]|uniref:zinc finger protein 260-like n=1 Tax=Onthophagus taurus TaxID=166361 RepID=UPI0039BE69C0
MTTTMDSTDDITYLNYLREKPSITSSFLLQSNDIALGVQDPTLNCETIFEEFDAGTHAWTIDGLPIFLDGSVITEDASGGQISLETRKIVLQEESELPAGTIECKETDEYPIEVPSEGFITSNGLFLPNDVLLQLNLQSEMQESDENAQSINTEGNEMEIIVNSDHQVYEVNFKKKDDYNKKISDSLININDLGANKRETIQLLNPDGSIINIDKDQLTSNGGKFDTNKEVVIDLGEQIETVTAYKCKKCLYLTESIDEISQHLIKRKCAQNPPKTPIKMKSILNTNVNKSKQVILLCSECNKGYTNTEDLKAHMIKNHQLKSQTASDNKQKENKNKDAGDKQRTQEYISIIKSQHKASKKVKCSVKGCDLRFALEDYRLRHEHCHVNGNKKQFRCPTCEKQFSIWRICSLHLWKCHEIDAGLLTCVTCNYKAFSAHKLLSHMLIHKEQKEFLCNECGKRFKQMSQLRNHQVLHLNHSQSAPNWSSHKKCDICNNIFADSKGLKKHIQSVHNKFKPYVCNICGHKSSRKAMLDLHLRQHTGEKPYSCHICSYRTGDHNSLRRHLMRHEGTKKYSCPHCSYQSIQSVAYKQHVATKHPGKDGVHFCKHCSFHSINKNITLKHEKAHETIGSKTPQGQQQVNVEGDGLCSMDEQEKCDDPSGTTKKVSKIEDDEETEHGFLTSIQNDETVDTGGITIPADLEIQQV